MLELVPRWLSLVLGDCQGGPGTLDTALEAAQVGTPLVVVEGSGQAADVIAYAFKLTYNQGGRHGNEISLVSCRHLIWFIHNWV